MSAFADGRSCPNGFSMTTRRHWPSFSVTMPAAPRPATDDAEKSIGDREIEQVVAGGTVRLVEPRKMLLQLAVGLAVG